jgi:outer membrane receptor protein involved in Fe transport
MREAVAMRKHVPAIRNAVSISIVTLLVSSPSLAQDRQQTSQDLQTLPPVEVIGTTPLPGIGISRELLPYPVQTATDQAIRKSSGGNLTEFMQQNLSGVNINEIQGSPFQRDVTFHGFRASSLLGAPQGISVFLDGVRINEGFGDVINWDMLPEAAIANLTLIPGSNPIYGLNTLGGALAFTTKSGLTHPGFEAEFSLGSFRRKRLDLSYGAKLNEGWHAFVAGTKFIEDGWRDSSSGHLGNVFVKFGHGLGRTKLDLSLLAGSSSLVGNGLLPDDLYAINRRAVYTHPDQTRNKVQQVSANLLHALNSNTEISGLLYIRKSKRNTVNGDINPAYEDYTKNCEHGFDKAGNPLGDDCGVTRTEGAAVPSAIANQTSSKQTTYGLGLNLSHEANDHTMDFGFTADRSNVGFKQLSQPGSFDASRGLILDPTAPRQLDAAVSGNSWNIALYAADTFAVTPDMHVTTSARYNMARVSNTLTNGEGQLPKESFDFKKFNPAIGLTHKLGNGLTLFGNASQSNRVPTVIELGCADPLRPCALPTGLQADPNLDQVVSRTIEAGLRFRGTNNSEYTASIYQTTNRNDILFLRAGATQLGYFDNFGRTRHRGLDLSARREIGPVTLRLNYSYLNATFDATGSLFAGERTVTVTPGTRIAGLPKHALKIGMDWKAAPQWTVGGDIVTVSSLVTQGNEDGLLRDPEEGEAPEIGNHKVGGYALLNLRASYKPTKQMEFFVRLNNALDRRYETYGVLAENFFPNGELFQQHVAEGGVEAARFVAPGAPRSAFVGVRVSF